MGRPVLETESATKSHLGLRDMERGHEVESAEGVVTSGVESSEKGRWLWDEREKMNHEAWMCHA